jgi:hypothetical protein
VEMWRYQQRVDVFCILQMTNGPTSLRTLPRPGDGLPSFSGKAGRSPSFALVGKKVDLVGTVKKPMAAIASLWFRRKASQRLAGSGSLERWFFHRDQNRASAARRGCAALPRLDSQKPLGRSTLELPSAWASAHPRPDSRDQFPVQAKTSPVPAKYGFQMQSEMGVIVGPTLPENLGCSFRIW